MIRKIGKLFLLTVLTSALLYTLLLIALDGLRGPKGSILEGIAPTLTLAFLLLWIGYVDWRQHHGKPVMRSDVWGVGILLFLGGLLFMVLYPLYLSTRPAIHRRVRFAPPRESEPIIEQAGKQPTKLGKPLEPR